MDHLTIAVSKIIKQKRKVPLLEHEARYIAQKIKSVDLSLFSGKPFCNVVSALATLINNELNKLPKFETDECIDVHEMLVKEIGNEPETSLLEKKVDEHATIDTLLHSPHVLQSIFNPQALWRKAYLILDRKYQADNSNNTTEFKWNIATTGKSYNPLSTVVTTAPLRDIIKIKMFPFRFPNSANTITEFNRLSVEIAELNTQAYIITHANKRFHFAFDIERTGAPGTTEPFIMNDIGNSLTEFEFHDPIIELNTITLRFGNPERLISLDPDSLRGTVSSVGAQTRITFTQPHLCPLGTTVVLSDFKTTDLVNDATEIELLNDPDGWAITALTSTTVTIDVDISGLVGAIIGNPFSVYLNAKRFGLKLELTYIADN